MKHHNLTGKAGRRNKCNINEHSNAFKSNAPQANATPNINVANTPTFTGNADTLNTHLKTNVKVNELMQPLMQTLMFKQCKQCNNTM